MKIKQCCPARLALTAVCLCTGPILQARAIDWPQFLGPDRNGKSAETGLTASWPKQGPPVVWEKPIGSGWAGPAIAKGKLILFHRQGNEEIVGALNPDSGKEIWKQSYPTDYRDDFNFDDGPRATPTITDGVIYTLGASGVLYAIALDDGKVLWRRDLNSDYNVAKGYFGVATSPLVEGGLLLINVGGPGAGIVALSRADGKEAWRATTDEASYSSPVIATIGGKRLAVFLTRLGIVVLEPATGKVVFNKRWRARINASVNAASPVVLDDRLFFTSSYGVGAITLKAKNGSFETLWQGEDMLSSHFGTPIASKGCLYGFDGRQEGGARLRCIDLDTGKVRWTEEGFGCGAMILAEERLYVLSETGELVCIDAQPLGYKERARAHVLDGLCRAQLALSDGRLYGRNTKKLVCWDLKAKP